VLTEPGGLPEERGKKHAQCTARSHALANFCKKEGEALGARTGAVTAFEGSGERRVEIQTSVEARLHLIWKEREGEQRGKGGGLVSKSGVSSAEKKNSHSRIKKERISLRLETERRKDCSSRRTASPKKDSNERMESFSRKRGSRRRKEDVV